MADEKKLKSIVLGLPGRSGVTGSAERFCKYLLDEGVDAKFVDCTELMQFKPYVAYNNTHLSRFLAREPNIGAVYCPIIDNGLRETFLVWARELGYKTPNFIHDNAEVDLVVKKKLKARPDAGIYVFEGAKIEPHVEIGDFSIIPWKVRIAKGAKIEKGVFISVGAKLGKDCIIHEHSYVDDDVPGGATVAGVPTKILKPKDLAK